MATLGAELGGDPGSLTQHAHRQNPATTQAPPLPGTGRGPTGSPTRRPAVATLGPKLVDDPGHRIPAPARRSTSPPDHPPTAGGHPRRRTRGGPGPPAAPVHLPGHRQWPPWALSSSAARGAPDHPPGRRQWPFWAPSSAATRDPVLSMHTDKTPPPPRPLRPPAPAGGPPEHPPGGRQ